MWDVWDGVRVTLLGILVGIGLTVGLTVGFALWWAGLLSGVASLALAIFVLRYAPASNRPVRFMRWVLPPGRTG